MRTITIVKSLFDWRLVVMALFIYALSTIGYWYFEIEPLEKERDTIIARKSELGELVINISGFDVKNVLNEMQMRQEFFDAVAVSKLSSLSAAEEDEISFEFENYALSQGMKLLAYDESGEISSYSDTYLIREIQVELEGEYKSFISFLNAKDRLSFPFAIKDVTIYTPGNGKKTMRQRMTLLVGSAKQETTG